MNWCSSPKYKDNYFFFLIFNLQYFILFFNYIKKKKNLGQVSKVKEGIKTGIGC